MNTLAEPTYGTDIADAIIWYHNERKKGTECPCCGRATVAKDRKISKVMANALVDFYRIGGTDEYVHGPSVVPRAKSDEAKLRYWGLTEERPATGEENSRGWWKVTPLGERFIRGETPVREVAEIYESECVGLKGNPVFIQDVLGRELTAAERRTSRKARR